MKQLVVTRISTVSSSGQGRGYRLFTYQVTWLNFYFEHEVVFGKCGKQSNQIIF